MAPRAPVSRASASSQSTSRHHYADNDRHYRPVPVGQKVDASAGRSSLPAKPPHGPTSMRTNSRGGIQKPGKSNLQPRRQLDRWTPSSSSSSDSSATESSSTDFCTGQDLDPILHDPDVSRDRRRQGFKYRTQDVARQFDVSLKHVQQLLRHMWKRYDTVTCFSTAMLQPGDIIYYINPFTLGPDQQVCNESAAYLGGSRFQTGVQAKGRFAIVVKVIGQYMKVVPVNTFNGQGLGCKPTNQHDLFVELHDPSHYHFSSVSPHQPLEVRKAFCEMRSTAAAHLLTTVVTLSQKIMIAGSIRPESLDRLKGLIQITEG